MVQSQPVRPLRQDRRRLRTRKAIMDAGQQLFAARSMEGVSIDDIIETADVAKGSFYNHFDDKESLADAIVELVQGDVEHHVFVANQDIADPAHRVARALAVVVRYGHEHPDRLRALLSLSFRSSDITAPINAGLRHDIERGIAGGQFKGIHLESGVLIVVGLIWVAVDYLSGRRSNRQSAQGVAEIASALLRALGVDPDTAPQIAAEASKILPEWDAK